MERNCRDCNTMDKEIYWKRFKTVRFFLALSGQFRHQIKVPQRFVKKLSEKLQEEVSLKAPSGATWKVVLKVEKNSLYFKLGWEEFIEDNSLGENDELMFVYNDSSSFDVLMFNGKNKCEKEASCLVRKCSHTCIKRESQRRKIENSEKISVRKTGRNCVNCHAIEKEIYWKCFKTVQFSRTLSGHFHHQLEVPKRFKKNLREMLRKEVSLKGPSGTIWKVELVTEGGSLYFKLGWNKFIENNFLEENDILIFQFNGNSNFDVLMFDGKSMCEKEASYFVRKCVHLDMSSEGRRENETSENISDQVLSGRHSPDNEDASDQLGESFHVESASEDDNGMEWIPSNKSKKADEEAPSSAGQCATAERNRVTATEGAKSKASARGSDSKLVVNTKPTIVCRRYISKEGRYMKGVKDPNKPKRPPTAFFVFMEDFRKEFKAKHPNNKAVSAVSKAAGERWKSLSNAEKAPYVAKADNRKAEYEKSIQAYNRKRAGEAEVEEELSDKSKSEVHDDEDDDDDEGSDEEDEDDE